MQKAVICTLLLGLGGCNTYLPDSASHRSLPVDRQYTRVIPHQTRLANPTVETKKGILEYADDLDRCKSQAASRMGSEQADDVAAIRRLVQHGPLNGQISVRYEESDPAFSRDKMVKNCLSRLGYLVIR